MDTRTTLYEEFAALNEDPSYFLDLRLLTGKINLEATIGLFCYDFNDVFAFGPIIRGLPQAEFVVAPHFYDVNDKSNKFYYNVLVRELEKERLPWRIFIPHHFRLQDFFAHKYQLIVSRRPSPLFFSPELLPLKKILLSDDRLTTTLAGTYAARNADAFLLPGPTREYPHRHFGRALDVGIARLDSLSPIPKHKRRFGLIYFPATMECANRFALTLRRTESAENFRADIGGLAVYLPTLPHGLSLPKKRMREFHKVLHNLEDAGITIFYENADPFRLIADARTIMVEDDQFLFDALHAETPIIFYEPRFSKITFVDRPYLENTNWRDFLRRDPNLFPLGVTLRWMQNLPVAFKMVENNRKNLISRMREEAERFISSHGGKATEKTAETIVAELLEERPAENFLARVFQTTAYMWTKGSVWTKKDNDETE